MGYTHIELLPVMEHPLDMSWGYQLTGAFMHATARYRHAASELMQLIDRCHQRRNRRHSGLGACPFFPAMRPGMYTGWMVRRCITIPDPRRGEIAQWGTMLF